MPDKIEGNNERLQKIVNMAKNGTEFERRNALTILEKICRENDFILDDIMDVDDKKKYEFDYTKLPIRVAVQIYFKIIGGKNVYHNRYKLFIECSRQKYIEFETAFNAYANGYLAERKRLTQKHRDENKAFPVAFIQRHEIFPDHVDEEERKERAKKITEKELQKLKFALRMAGDMEDDIIINKQLR